MSYLPVTPAHERKGSGKGGNEGRRREDRNKGKIGGWVMERKKMGCKFKECKERTENR